MTNTRADTNDKKMAVIKRLLKLWEANPQMRLPQLIGNVYHIPSGDDPYYVEDFDFIKALEKYYDRKTTPPLATDKG